MTERPPDLPSASPQHPLDNPIWHSLAGRHAALAQRHGEVARYPADVAPFVGVAHAGIDAGAALAALVAPGESVYLLGIAPRVPAGWVLEEPVLLAQMVCAQRIEVVAGPPIVELTDAHRDDVLALTALVYPHYFRPCTMALGRYFGIYDDGRLAALIGERMGLHDHQEISAVCTHPDYAGRGLARRLLAWLGNDNLDRGRTPFLHVSQQNVRAMRMYAQAGYGVRRDLPFWSLRAPAKV